MSNCKPGCSLSSSLLCDLDITNGLLTSCSFREVPFPRLIQRITPVSPSESNSGLETVTQLAETEKTTTFTYIVYRLHWQSSKRLPDAFHSALSLWTERPIPRQQPRQAPRRGRARPSPSASSPSSGPGWSRRSRRPSFAQEQLYRARSHAWWSRGRKSVSVL